MNRYPRIAIAMFVIALVGATAWRWFCTPVADDYVYMRATVESEPGYDQWDKRGEMLTEWHQVWPTVKAHMLTQNARLPNALAYIADVTPSALTDVMCGVCIALLPLLMLWAAAGRAILQRGPTVVAAYALMWITLPWEDYMQSLDFFLNYVPGSVLAMAVMVLWRTRRAAWLAIAASFFCGWWHEGFGLPLLGWMCAILITDSTMRTRRHVWMIVALALGSLILLPGVADRVFNEMTEEVDPNASRLRHLTRFATYAIVPVVYMCMLGLRCNRRGGLRAWLPMAVAVAIACAEGFAVGRDGRTMWCATLFALVGLYAFWGARRRWLRTVPRRLSAAVVAVGMAAYSLFAWQLAYWQHIIKNEQPIFVDGRLDLSTHLYFAETPSRQLPWWTLSIPRNDYLTTRCYHGASLLRQWGAYNAILPPELERRSFAQWPKVPGRNPFRGTVDAMFARDTLEVRDVTLRYGSPTVSTPPWWGTLTAVGLAADSKTVRGFWSGPIVHRGDTLWYFVPALTGRSLRTRVITAIDKAD